MSDHEGTASRRAFPRLVHRGDGRPREEVLGTFDPLALAEKPDAGVPASRHHVAGGGARKNLHAVTHFSGDAITPKALEEFGNGLHATKLRVSRRFGNTHFVPSTFYATCVMVRRMEQNDPESHDAVFDRLEAVRKVLGVATKREFAERAGIAPQSYGDVRKRGLSLSAGRKLASEYGLPLDFIYRGIKADLPHRIAKDL